MQPRGVASFLVFLAYLAGFTSIGSSLISAANSQARIIFNSGREGLLPSVAGRVTARTGPRTWRSSSTWCSRSGSPTCSAGHTDPVEFFGEIATLGTILIALTYLRRQPRAARLLPALSPRPALTGDPRRCCRCSARSRSDTALPADQAGPAGAVQPLRVDRTRHGRRCRGLGRSRVPARPVARRARRLDRRRRVTSGRLRRPQLAAGAIREPRRQASRGRRHRR